MRMWWQRCLAYSFITNLEIVPNIVANAPKMTGKCDCHSCTKRKLIRKPFTSTAFSATELLQHLHSDICIPLEVAIGGGRNMLRFIDNTTRNTDHYILRYKLEARKTFKESNILREMESGTEVKQFRKNWGGESTSKKLAEYLQSGGILMKITMPCTVQSNRVVEQVNHA